MGLQKPGICVHTQGGTKAQTEAPSREENTGKLSAIGTNPQLPIVWFKVK